MRRIAKFEQVSFAQFSVDCGWPDAEDAYASVRLPVRATAGSAGYDFSMPSDLTLPAGETARVATGVRARMEPGWVLMLYPRSGLGFRYRLQLDNTVGVVDSDYYFAENEGHILIQITNDSKEGKTLSLRRGDRFAQGIFVAYGITEDDAAAGARKGGFGSTAR